jgi:hypothetical protein
MTIGENALFSGFSYFALGRETSLNAGGTATASLEPISNSFSITKENAVLERITRKRVYSKSIGLGKVIEASIENDLLPSETGSAWLIQNAMGGAITSATSTGETVGGLGFTHTIELGDMENSYTSLNANCRLGGSTGKVFELSGLRVNELEITAELDAPLKMASTLMGVDATSTTNNIESALTSSCHDVLNFDNGRTSFELTYAALTTTSFWHVQNMSFTLGNSIKSDANSRRIGSDILSVMPVGIATMQLKVTMRYDTTTAYDAMIAGTNYSAEFDYTSNTMAGSVIEEGFKMDFPKLVIAEAPIPEIGGPDEILTNEVTFNVLQDCSSSGGYAVKAYLTNLVANYN